MALWILAGLLGLAALLITAQLLARQSTLEAQGYRELRALGMTTRQIWTVGMVRTALLAVVASVVGIVGAAAVSAVFPIGLAAIAEPHPGFTIDVTTLSLALALAVVVIVAVAAWPNWRAAVGIVVGHPSDRSGIGRSRAVTLARGSWARRPRWSPASASPSNGAAAGRPCPVRSTIAASVIGIAALAGAVVFSSSLSNLVATPGSTACDGTPSSPRPTGKALEGAGQPGAGLGPYIDP